MVAGAGGRNYCADRRDAARTGTEDAQVPRTATKTRISTSGRGSIASPACASPAAAFAAPHFNLGILQGLAAKGRARPGRLPFERLRRRLHSFLAGCRGSSARASRNELGAWQQVMSCLVPLPHHEAGQLFQAVWPSQIQWLAPVQQLPHAAQRSIHRRYLGRRRFVDTQCVGEPGAADLDLSCRALCAPSVRSGVHLQSYRAAAATNSSVVSSVTAGGAKTTLTLDLGPAQPVEIADGLARTPTSPSRKSSRRYVCWNTVTSGVPHLPLEHSCVPLLSAGRRGYRHAPAPRILRGFALERGRDA